MNAPLFIEPGKARRIGSIAALLGSNQSGEVLAAANMLSKELAKYDLRIGDVVERGLAPPQPPPPPVSPRRSTGVAEHVVRAGSCIIRANLYSPKEMKFLKDVRNYRRPSEKQLDWLDALCARWAGEVQF